MERNGYVNGSDMLLYVGEKAVGSCSTHSTDFKADTKERAVKPKASVKGKASTFKRKSVTAHSISISAEGFVCYDETECGFNELLKMWKEGAPVKCKCMERDNSKPYLVGDFILTSLKRTDPAQEDSTYSISLENDGAPETLDETVIQED